MMLRPTSPRERRLLALLILAAMLASVWLFVVAPILDGFSARAEEREQLQLRYMHDLRTIGAIPRLRRQADVQRAATRDVVLQGRNAEDGREQLKLRLQHAIENAGGLFREAGDAEGRPGWVAARASASMTLPQANAAIAALQDAPPWLVVETMILAPSDAPAVERSSNLDVQIEISVPFRPAAAR